MKVMMKLIVLCITLLWMVGCTEFNTIEETHLADQDGDQIIVTELLDEEVFDIEDEAVPLGDPFANPSEFDLSRFTNLGNLFIQKMDEDIQEHIEDEAEQSSYDEIAMVPNNDLMSVVSIELEHMMQFDEGFWTDRKTPYPNKNGFTISSFTRTGDVYEYLITYKDNTGSYKDVTVYYNEALERYDYSSRSYDNDGRLSYIVWQQFSRSEEGGFYYQALRHSLSDEMERASFSYFDGDGYICYAKPNGKGLDMASFNLNLFEEKPGSIEDLIRGYGTLGYLQRNALGFSYDLAK